MFTLPCHKHNPIKITLKNGETILAKITRFDTDTGKVSWKDKDGNWKGSTHCTRVIKATPEEVLAWSKAKADKVAPIDFIMKDWDIGKTKRGPQMMEGHYYCVNVLLCGKKVGKIVDYGNGGPVDLEFCDRRIQNKFLEDTKKWELANGGDAKYGASFEDFWHWMEDDRLKGIDAKTYFTNQKAMFAEWEAKYPAKVEA